MDLEFPDVYFTPGYGRCELLPGDEWATICSPDGAWQVPVVLRHFAPDVVDASSPYGYAGIYVHASVPQSVRAEYWAQTKALLRAAGVASFFVRDSPLVSTYIPPSEEVVPVVSGHQTVSVPLGSEEEMWGAMLGRARTTLRKARASDLQACRTPAIADDLAPGSDFRVLYAGTMERLGAAAHYFFSDDYFERLAAGLPGRLGIVRVRDAAGECVAACLILEHEKYAHYHLSASTPEGAKNGANVAMIWEAMTTAALAGREQLMLGGSTGGGQSLLRFKKSFSRTELAFNAFGVVIDEERYRRGVDQRCAAALVGADQLTSTGFFPAYRAPL